MQTTLILPAITGNLDVPGGNLLLEPHPKVRLAGDIEGSEFLSHEQKRKAIGGEKYRMFSWDMWDRVGAEYKRSTGRNFSYYYLGGVGHPPSIWRAITTGQPYPIKGLLTICQNPLLTFANTRLVYKALKEVEFSMNMDIFMTSSCQLADYVLPAAGHLEKPTMGHGGNQTPLIEAGATAIKPLYERRNEYDVIRELGLRLGQQAYWPWQTLEEAFDYRLEPMGLTFDEFVKGMGGYGFDNPGLRHRKYDEPGFRFGTPTGKFELYSTIMEDIGYDPLPGYTEPPRSLVSNPELAKEYPLCLLSGPRARYQYQSQFHQIDSFRKRYPDPIVQINPGTARALGINDGDWAWIETPLARVKFKCAYFDGIDPRVVSAEHGWWYPDDPGEEPSLHGLWRSNINAVVDDNLEDCCDPRSGAWMMRELLCKVYKAED
jgi:thiosulfate reductase/polysulfide reductase chain A